MEMERLPETDMMQEGASSNDFPADEDDLEDYNDDFSQELQDLELKNLMATGFNGLDNVNFDEDEEEEEILDSATSYGAYKSKAIVLAEQSGQDDDDEEEEIGSDEEQDILKNIREDIEQRVREEMQDELVGYKQRLKAIEERHKPRTDDEKTNDPSTNEDEEMDPKLKEAIIKMNKLDKILRKKVKKEKEVKKERLILEKRMREEISAMEHGSANYREIKINTERFLALAPPPSHNEGVTLEPEDEDEEVPPLFQTQIDDSELGQRRKGKGKAATDDSTDKDGSSHETRVGSSASSVGGHTKSSRSGVKGGPRSQGRKPKKDFIKRNKELAGEADQPVAMTDDEKRRLQTLLEDVDGLPEIEADDDVSALMEMNPFQVMVHPGEGFCPDSSESRSLSVIDQRLRGLMPEEDYRAVFTAGTTTHGEPPYPLFTRVGLRSNGNDNVALERFGERVLYETKEERELQARLQAIESQLELFKAPSEPEEEEGTQDYHLTDEQLDDLLDQCARNMGITDPDSETPGPTPRSQLSSRQSLLANAPKLSDEQLQQLLSDAHFPLSSRLLALRDDDQKMEEEDGSAEVIRAETWIAIRDAHLTNDVIPGDMAASISSDQILAETDTSSNQRSDLANQGFDENQNVSKNNASDSARPDKSERGESNGLRSIDDFVYTPDIINPAYDNNVFLAHKDGDAFQDQDVRMASGGARPKYSSSGRLPRLPKQLSSSSLVASADCDTPGVRFNSSSYASTSQESFHSAASTPTPSNTNSYDSQAPVKLPEISSSSFLIHTQQGMNNEESAQPQSSRQPLNMVRNNLTDMSVTSLSGENNEVGATPLHYASPSTSINNGDHGKTTPTKSLLNRRSSSQSHQGIQPTPPSSKRQS